jgi:heme-degrading monooxygenase HmoA
MVIRQWRGIAKKEREASYLTHFRADILPKLRGLPGFLGATVLRRETDVGVELTVLTRWDSIDNVRAFAGTDLNLAVVAAEAQSCFRSYDETVSHHDVLLEETA